MLPRQGFYQQSLGRWLCCLSIFFLCSKTWAVGPPSLQIARDSNNALTTSAATGPRIAIIIDDIGYNLKNGTWAAGLPGALTLSVLPQSPHGREIASFANSQQKEVMLHAPMSSIWDKPLDPGGLTSDMSHDVFINTLKENLARLPHIQGVNNHMGSQLTQFSRPMSWLMEELRRQGLYFVDSRTIAASLAWETALDYGVPTSRRDVFLDNEPTFPAIARQFGELLVIAKSRGQAIAIAHPYPETLRFLQAALPMLELTNVRLVPVSDLLSSQARKPITVVRSKRAVDSPREVIGLINYLAE